MADEVKYAKGFSASVDGVVRNEAGEIMAESSDRFYGLSYAGLVDLEGTHKAMRDAQYQLGVARVAALATQPIDVSSK